ncbi:MAG TPA: tRNA lysidine(34) synthetase TilS [Leptospiraceae bacterium]|nr:tRNA lysidine(34) synthetase TilS [Leptospiraceae bacterium]HMX55645.1 tRNA lysidine(34) synthetase TilS [Leptospiraceae bacterium]HMY44081.1 tRNA lysidine(34) synthetase TilS [Leptospiraceae bacterium]HMZ38185.1 tRNA lysidine(34) synthetase TilS [Leptospiraceae bacterium]HNE24326.1 tRNA lysidine(34) synthetase TilS [Leptospiraceae bacterium]
MRDLLDRLQQVLKFAPPGIPILCVSGGQDSMLLLHAYRSLFESGIGLPEPVVFHLDHRLREDSGLDADFVIRTAREAGFSVYLESRNVGEFSRRSKVSLEEAGRVLRYRTLARLVDRIGSAYAVTAHHADDYLESVLIHLIRGGGASALSTLPLVAGIHGVTVFRPFLSVRKSEIERYATSFEFREDSSNKSQEFLRNRIRAHIAPVLLGEGLDPVRLWQNFHAELWPAGIRVPAHHVRVDRSLVCGASLADIKQQLDLATRSLGIPPVSRSLALSLYNASRKESFRFRFRTNELQAWCDERSPLHIFRSDSPLLSPPQMTPQVDGVSILYGGKTRFIALRTGERARMFEPGLRVRMGAGHKKLKKVFQEEGVPSPVRPFVPLLVDQAGFVIRAGLSFLGQKDLFFSGAQGKN